ncbi:unnamed protein product [Adineta ricciae]|uniref:Uncharacterized protein n=1 Tax=Adineta ricciae TaxID=249248 RepID=A0A813SQI2_ADIRI|nr:unnamed protein product [Adineta ricciae]CAF1290937.1 unnamed protein product [Adineta ricciae]
MVAGEFVGGNSLTQLINPGGVVFDSSMNIYGTDVGNQRNQKFLKFQGYVFYIAECYSASKYFAREVLYYENATINHHSQKE